MRLAYYRIFYEVNGKLDAIETQVGLEDDETIKSVKSDIEKGDWPNADERKLFSFKETDTIKVLSVDTMSQEEFNNNDRMRA